MLDEGTLDAATAARVRAIAAACPLAITQVYGSAEGRVTRGARAVVIERGGRHALIAFDDRVERWDLDAIACVASRPLSREVRAQGARAARADARDDALVRDLDSLALTPVVESVGTNPTSGRKVYRARTLGGAALWQTDLEGPS